jgi:hypothetical protein
MWLFRLCWRVNHLDVDAACSNGRLGVVGGGGDVNSNLRYVFLAARRLARLMPSAMCSVAHLPSLVIVVAMGHGGATLMCSSGVRVQMNKNL